MSCILRTALPSRLNCRHLATAMVYLLDKDGKIIAKKTKVAAEQFAKKNNCLLVQRNEDHLKYDAFMMIDPRRGSEETEILSQEPGKPKSESKQRPRKKMTMALTICEHDRKFKSKKIVEWLKSGYEVEVAVYNQNTSKERFKQFFEAFMTELPGANVLQQIFKDHQFKFRLVGSQDMQQNSPEDSPLDNADDADDARLLEKLLREENAQQMVGQFEDSDPRSK